MTAILKAFPGLQKLSSSSKFWSQLASICLWSAFLTYALHWISNNYEPLFNPLFQADDARTHLYSYHRYGQNPELKSDRIANMLLLLGPYGLRAIYSTLVPLVDVPIAAKIVQGVVFSIVVLAGVTLARSPRMGLGSGILLIFLYLHSWTVIAGTLGGLPRGFGVPFLLLWGSGILSKQKKIRVVAIFGSALSYPIATVILLCTEGILVFTDVDDAKEQAGYFPKLKFLAIVGTLCVLLLTPLAIEQKDYGGIFSFKEAQKMPLFNKGGRLQALPFKDPVKDIFGHGIRIFKPAPKSPTQHGTKPTAASWKKAKSDLLGLGVLTGLALLILLRLTSPPKEIIALGCGTVLAYFIARFFAFRFFDPSRIFHHGTPPFLILLIAGSIGHSFRSFAKPETLKNIVTTLLLLLMLLVAGDGIPYKYKSFIRGNDKAALYEKVRSLPKDSRIAAHPNLADSLAFWSARATSPGINHMAPWFRDVWKYLKVYTVDTLKALYARKWKTVFDYAKKYNVTHFVIEKYRYRRRTYRSNVVYPEPFRKINYRILNSRPPSSLVFGKVPPAAIVFEHKGIMLVEVKALRQAWQKNR